MRYIDHEKLERARQFRRQQTEGEALLWSVLRGRRADFKFRRQVLLSGFIVDFYCHGAALVVEVDGDIHDQRAEQDEERTRVLERRGLLVLRFSNESVANDLWRVVATIRQQCAARLHPPSREPTLSAPEHQ